MLCLGQIKLSEDAPLLEKTLLGWVVAGRWKQLNTHPVSRAMIATSEHGTLEALVERLWEIEKKAEIMFKC